MQIVSQLSGQGKPDAFEELVGQLRHFVHHAAQQGCAAHEVERELFKRLLQLGLLLLKAFFAQLGQGDEGEQVEVEGIGRLSRSKEVQARRYVSIFGELVLHRWTYARGQKRRVEYASVDARARLPRGKFSFLLQDWTQKLAADLPFAQVQAFLHGLLGVKLTVASLEQLNRALAEEVEAFIQAQPAPPPARGESLVVLSADAKGVAMRKAPEAPAKQALSHDSGPKPGRKKMALVGAAYQVEPYVRTPLQVLEALFGSPPAAEAANDPPARPAPQHKQVRAALSEAPAGQAGHSAQVIFPWLRRQAQGRDPKHERPWVVVMDGQHSLWTELDNTLGQQPRVEILDLLHAAGYLWEAVHLFHTPGSDNAQRLMKLCLLSMLQGQIKDLMIWLTDQAQQVALSAKAGQRLAQIAAYFQYHHQRMHYEQYLAQGYPIASGVIEGACRHVVNDRLERTGMNWTLPGAQAMLALRCVVINQQWKDFMDYRIKQETARLYPYASNDGPDSGPCSVAA